MARGIINKNRIGMNFVIILTEDLNEISLWLKRKYRANKKITKKNDLNKRLQKVS